MCGICGIVQVSGPPRPPVEAALIERMADAMTHRGPDDRGIYRADGVALGVRRLSIIDVAGGHQPFANEDGAIRAIQNGEIFNYATLREELLGHGHQLHSRCDTEVIPHLYERDRDDFPLVLRGMYGIAVWDERQRRLVLARDRLGVKPLYYARAGDLLLFASELKSLLAPGLVSLELDPEAIDAYLTLGYVPAPRTPLRQVHKLLPGHRLIVAKGEVRVEAYWHYPLPNPISGRSEEEWAEGLIHHLDEAVRLRMISDRPVGAMLSGGLDSSLVVALMARHSATPINTFAIGFRGAGPANELADARLVAERFGTVHHEMELALDEEDLDLEGLVWSLDEPVADLSALGFLKLSGLAARHVTVALSGQGADELLGGYRKHQAAALCGRLPGPLRLAISLLGGRGPRQFRRLAATLGAANPAERLLAMSGQLPPALRSRLLRGPLASLATSPALGLIEQFLDSPRGDPLAETLFLDAQLALPDDLLHYFDRASMAHSLEARVPFLDHPLVEFCATIPSHLKVRRFDRKYLLKRAAANLLPPRIIHKPKIGFFRNSVDAWFDRQLPGLAAQWFGPTALMGEFVDRGQVTLLVADHLTGRDRSHQQLILGLLMLEVWLSAFLPRVSDGSPQPSRRPYRAAPLMGEPLCAFS